MDRADELRAEYVGKIGGNGCKAAAIHRQDDAEGKNEERLGTHRCQRRGQRIKNDAKHEEAEVSVLAADFVGHGSPEEAATDVKQRQQAREPGRDGGDRCFLLDVEVRKTNAGQTDQRTRENLLQHWRCHADHADTR
ncbi:hypothetical protein D3C80_1807080 [compost metagenome]